MTPRRAGPWTVIGSASKPIFLPVLTLCLLWATTAQSADPIVAHIDSLWTSDQREAAITLLEAELPLARAANDSALISTLLVSKGAYNNFLGNVPLAEAALREGVAMARARRDSTLLMPGIRWLGRVIASQGRRDEARVFTHELLAVATLQGDRRHQGWANLSLGFGYWRKGEPESALEHYQNAAAQFVGTGEVQGELWAHNGIANAYSNLGRYDEAAMGYLATIEAARAHQSTAAEASALNNLGTLEYSLGRPDAALGHFRQAWDLQNQLRRTRQQLATLFNISLCQADLGQKANARQTLDEALAICDQHGYQDMRSRTLIKTANMELQRNRLNRAEELIAEAMQDPATTMVKDVIAARSELGEAYRLRGDLATAILHFDQADSLLGDKVFPWVRLRLTGYRARALRDLGEFQRAQDQFLALAAEAANRSMPQYRLAALSEIAYTNLLRDRPDTARAFYLEAASAWESNRQQALSPQWRERRGSNGQLIFADLALLIHEAGNPGEAFDRLQAYKSRTLLERMLGPGEALTESIAHQGDLQAGLSDVQNRLLAEDELLLDFTLGLHGSVLYAVTRDTLVMRRLPETPVIAERVRAYYDLLQDPTAGSDAAITVMGDGLAEMLLSDLPEVFARQTRFLVAPDGVLNLLPFADLEIRDQAPDWIRVPSASILLKLRNDGPRNQDGPWHTLAVASNWGLENATLSGTMLEVERLTQNYKNVQSQILSGDEITLPSLGGFDVLHLAAHASNDDQSPWQSAIHFLPEEQGGNLRATDVLNLDLSAGLAVLSSCSSGTGKIINGEGVLGLSTAFLGAGVPAVLASLWAVDDGATAQFMEYFYGFLADGDDCARALTNTQRELRKHADTSHPYYWAAFVLVGDGTVEPHLVPKRKRPGPVILAAVAMGFLIPVILFRGRKTKGSTEG
ncbi:MAG: CHAT domain-containing protein [Candidatus Krumholzibacteria bacterium]|nr:CHAT domain-containing protein [Candidatus Krumholzibacteria bacterium]